MVLKTIVSPVSTGDLLSEKLTVKNGLQLLMKELLYIFLNLPNALHKEKPLMTRGGGRDFLLTHFNQHDQKITGVRSNRFAYGTGKRSGAKK